MNIAHLLPYSAKFPLTVHHGRYDWALRLAKLQSAKGHHVTIYCAPGSYAPETESLEWSSIEFTYKDSSQNNIALIRKAFADKHHDVYHSHYDYLPFIVADLTDKPIITTQHWFPSESVANAATYNYTKNAVAVPVTHFMKTINQRMNIPTADAIYHGIDLDLFQPDGHPRSDRLLFVGRIAPHKGVDTIVQAVKIAGAKLDIIGKVNDTDMSYWQSILPDVDGKNIRYLGSLPHRQIPGYMSQAKALLFASSSHEAFGQTIIEAQACGTPVILPDLGANRELVAEGATAIFARTPEEFANAINKLQTIDYNKCREWAEKFDIGKMAHDYEQLYRSMK